MREENRNTPKSDSRESIKCFEAGKQPNSTIVIYWQCLYLKRHQGINEAIELKNKSEIINARYS